MNSSLQWPTQALGYNWNDTAGTVMQIKLRANNPGGSFMIILSDTLFQ